jgi:hypothetical protein
MIEEYAVVVLTRDLPECGLKAGAFGTVVDVYRAGEAYMVEFNDIDDTMLALPVVPPDAIRRASDFEIERRRAMHAASVK